MSTSATHLEARSRRAVVWQRAAMSRAAQNILLIVLPVFVTVTELSISLGLHHLAVDFLGWYWPAGHRVLHGVSPYVVSPNAALNYPAFGALVFVPFALVSHGAAEVVFLLLIVASVPTTLVLLGVRDWRAYAIVGLWQPVVVGWETANISLLLVCGLAVVWRFRERAAVSGIVLAGLISVKIFLFPVAIWMLATRRLRAFAWTCAATLVLNLVSWAILGFDQVSVYLHVLNAFAGVTELRGYSLIGLMRHLGASQPIADGFGLGAAAAVVTASLRSEVRRRDMAVFTGSLAACLWASPVVESHYIALLLIPVALAAPVLSWRWFPPIALFLVPADHPVMWEHVFSLAVTLILVISCMGWRPEPRRSASAPRPSSA